LIAKSIHALDCDADSIGNVWFQELAKKILGGHVHPPYFSSSPLPNVSSPSSHSMGYPIPQSYRYITALAFVASIISVGVTGSAWASHSLVSELGMTADTPQIRFILSVGPLIPLTLIVAGRMESMRVALGALAVFAAWAPHALVMVRKVDYVLNGASEDQNYLPTNVLQSSETNNGAAQFIGGMISLVIFDLISFINMG
jgi:hypothetical protein